MSVSTEELMSDTPESRDGERFPVDQPPPDQSPVHRREETAPQEQNMVKELVLWRRKRLNAVVLSAATAIWVLMEIYQYTFVTLFSYTAMALLLLLFVWANTHRLLQREAPDLSGFEISEETTVEAAKLCRRRVEEALRMFLHASVERQWFELVGAIAVLYLLSLVGKYLDFVTIVYLGLVGSLTVPMVYMRNEQRIKEWVEKLRIRSQRLYPLAEEKLKKLKNLIGGRKNEVKVKKTE